MADRHAQVIASHAAVGPVAASGATLVICADGGVAVAMSAGRTVDLVVGDLDSASAGDLARAESAGATIETHPTTKDESDLELALAAAIERGATSVTAHLASGGRLDHQLANLLVLASPRWAGARVDAWVGDDRVWVVWDSFELPLEVGEPVAIHSVGGPAKVATRGLAFPLDEEVLDPTQARGIANEVVEVPAVVRVLDGVVLVISSTPPDPWPQSAQAT